jgi:uncharacterized damage-inducible protein DinB
MSAKKILLAQYDLHILLFNNVIKGISNEEANQSLGPGLNTVKWLAGHLLWNEGSLANIGGIKVVIPWADHFYSIEGATEEDLNALESELPTLEMIKNKWNEISPSIRAGLANLSDEALDTKIDIPHPIHRYNDTLAGLWAFTNDHQAYTIGQIAALRRGLGKPGMSYGN